MTASVKTIIGAVSSTTNLTVSKVALVSIAISPSASSIPLGDSIQLKAIGTYSDQSTQDVTNSVTWASSAPNIAVVNSNGGANSTSIGVTTITANSGSVNASTPLTILPPALVSISIGTNRSTIPLGAQVQLTAQGTYTDGSTQNLTNSISWTSSPGGILGVNTSGLATGQQVGTATVTAGSGTISGSLALTVSAATLASITVASGKTVMPLGTTQQLTATGTYTDGTTHDVTNSVSWSSAPGGVLGVSTSGLATGQQVGTATVSAGSGTISGSLALTVSTAALTSITVASGKTVIPLGTMQQLTATGTYTDGTTQNLTSSVSWSTSPGGILGVNTSGLAIGQQIGTVTVTAGSGTISGSLPLTVSAAALASITLASGKTVMPIGTTQQLTATGTYTDGTTHDLTSSVSWSSAPGGILGVNASGLATGLQVGTAIVTAGSGTISGALALTVSAATLASITLASANTMMPLGTTQQLTATGTYTDGTTHDLTNSVSWNSSPGGILGVSTSGLATGQQVGTATVNVTSGTISGALPLTVSAAALTSITVASGNTVMPLGTTQQLTATGTYTDGTTQNLTNSVSWSSASGLTVSVSGSGVASAMALGSTIVSAAGAGFVGSEFLTVTPPALTSISISPANPTIPLASSLQLAATGSYTDGSTQDLTGTATWTVDNAAIVSVNSIGNATALQVGSTTLEATFSGIAGSTTIVVQPTAATGYFSTGSSGVDSTIRVTNPGTNGQDLCAMIYVFDQDQQMAECCGCLISQDGLRTLSLNNDLIGNPLTGVSPVTGSIMLVTADHTSNLSCDASSITPTGMGVAWATHLQTLDAKTSVVTEEPLSQIPLGTTLSSNLQAQCQFIQLLGSGQGVCSCGTGH
jgi:hypothetical protein